MSSAFAWTRCQTRHFGVQWVPFAQLNIRAANGRWESFSVQIDTGAVISVLARSATDLLGLRFDAGDPIDLTSVGGASHRYYVYRLITRIGGLPERTLRIAIAETENAPNLLGRLDFLDSYRLSFDSTECQTTVEPIVS